jgi:hypothetical protein
MQENSTSEFLTGHVVNNFFVHYDNEGKVSLVSNVKDETLNNFEISTDLIPNFVRGFKDCTKYKIDYFFNIGAGLISDIEEQEDLVKTDYILHELSKKELKTYDILFEHDSVEQAWSASVMFHAVERLAIVADVPFYVCKKDNPYFLIAEYYATAADLIDGSVKFKFNSDLELDFSKLSVYTVKKFREYCVREKNVE